MSKHWAVAILLVSCAACAPGEQVAGPEPAAPEQSAYATQLDAPAPDYGPMIADPPIPPRARSAATPLPRRLRTPKPLARHGSTGWRPPACWTATAWRARTPTAPSP